MRVKKPNPALEAFRAGWGLVEQSAVLGPLMKDAEPHFDDSYPMAKEDWAWVDANGNIFANSHRRAVPQAWAYVISHCLLHLALGHVREDRDGDAVWNAACDCVVVRYLADLHIGTPPEELSCPLPPNVREEERLYNWLKEHHEPSYFHFSTMCGGRADMVWKPRISHYWRRGPTDWRQLFAESLRDALRTAVDYAGGVRTDLGDYKKMGPVQRAQEWFMSSYPLLGGVASGFKLVTDQLAVQRMDIPVAAISCHMKEIYVNMAAKLTEPEWRFVLAHE